MLMHCSNMVTALHNATNGRDCEKGIVIRTSGDACPTILYVGRGFSLAFGTVC